MYDRWPATAQSRVTGGIRHMANLSRNWDAVSKASSRLPGGPRGPAGFSALASRPGIPPPNAIGQEMTVAGRVSDPGTDMNYGGLAGFVQSETSTAWCSPNVVVGFNDSGSQLESNFLSFNGVSRSTNNGTRFTDLGYLPVTSFDYFLSGDPVLRCTDANTFYYASLLLDYGAYQSAISVSKSTSGGLTFDNPVKVAAKSLVGHFLDKEWMAVDPSNPQNLYVTYTDFDSTGDTCGSTTTTSGVRAPDHRDQDRAGEVERRRPDLDRATRSRRRLRPRRQSGFAGGRERPGSRVRRLHPFRRGRHGDADRPEEVDDRWSHLRPEVTVAEPNSAGLFGVLQGNLRINEFPTLAVDNSSGLRAGHVYVAWTDGSLAYPEFLGTYRFTDILFQRSIDAGETWSTSVRVNNNVDPIPAGSDVFLSGRGTDQFFPGIAVDRAGAIAICWYDRRRDKNNFLIDRECGKSTNGGATWSQRPQRRPVQGDAQPGRVRRLDVHGRLRRRRVRLQRADGRVPRGVRRQHGRQPGREVPHALAGADRPQPACRRLPHRGRRLRIGR